MTELISVIISIYNRPDALDAVLRGLSRQTDRNFEVVASDDGSPPSTAAWSSRGRIASVFRWPTSGTSTTASGRRRFPIARS